VRPLFIVDVLLRGMSQGLFTNNPISGLLYWVAMLQVTGSPVCIMQNFVYRCFIHHFQKSTH